MSLYVSTDFTLNSKVFSVLIGGVKNIDEAVSIALMQYAATFGQKLTGPCQIAVRHRLITDQYRVTIHWLEEGKTWNQ